MATKKPSTTKKPTMKSKATKAKQPIKSSKAKILLSRLNVSIPKALHNKIKQFAVKNKITAQEIISSAVKEYFNKLAVTKNVPATENTV